MVTHLSAPGVANTNPLLLPWTTSFGLPRFGTFKPADFRPAFAVALKSHLDELDAIAVSLAPPTFENTVAAFDKSGRLLSRIKQLFENLTASETSPDLQSVERDMAAPLAAHSNALYTHLALFARIDSVFQQRTDLELNSEQRRLVERIHLDFVRAGAKLTPEAQTRYGQVMEQLAELTTAFTQNVLAAEAQYKLALLKDDLAGLPDAVVAAAKQASAERGDPNGYAITLSRSLVVPFLTFSDRRDLRQQAFIAWTERGGVENLAVAQKIMALRLEQAQLHGFENYSDYALVDTMAGTRQAVDDLLMRLWEPAKAKAADECAVLNELSKQLTGADAIAQIEPWDWRYLAEKVRASRYDLHEAELKPYFPLSRMVEAIFDCAQRLFGIRFVERPDLKSYHPDVKTYEVHRVKPHAKSDENSEVRGSLIGIFMHDNFARATKRGGAWMDLYRYQRSSDDNLDGNILPIVVNNNNFAKGEPTLLSFDDARTLFHEFGHGLHGLLSNVHYERLSGTNVLKDFVELPSQLYEHWLSEPEVLKRFALHYETNEPIPDALIAKLKLARTFNQGFENVEFVAAALLDMALHSLSNMDSLDLVQFETEQLARLGMPKEIVMRHRFPHFQHLFSSAAYASGYYVYLWAAVLDADGFEAFTEASNPFDPAIANRLLENIYAAGNTKPPMDLYRAFRGKEPSVEAMLRKKGLLPA